MIPKVNNRGYSFKGVMAYLMHDKGAETSDRVAWSETGNMITKDPERAAFVMAWTDQNADLLKRDAGGSPAGKNTEAGAVYHYSLSWAHGEQPDQAHQRNEALKTLERLGLKDHEYVLVAHNDTEHAHVHIVANLTNPDNGKRHTPSFDKKELQHYALEYEREHGLHCQMREENAAKRERGEYTKHQSQKQDYSDKITRAYYASDNGKSFAHALEAEGLHLARARRGQGFVIVDEKGDIQKLARQLDIEEKGKAKTAAINARLADIEHEKLLDADVLAKQIKQAQLDREKDTAQAEYYDRDAQEIKQQKDLADAAHRSGKDAVAKEEAEAVLARKKAGILARAKQDWAELKERQPREKKALEDKLRAQDSPKEAAHRGRWQSIIDEDKQRKLQLETGLKKGGVAGLWFRVRHGKQAREEIAALDKNLDNARMRLDEGVGGLTGRDRYQLVQLNKTHKLERDKLKSRIDIDLKQIREQTENKVLHGTGADSERDNLKKVRNENIKSNSDINYDFYKSNKPEGVTQDSQGRELTIQEKARAQAEALRGDYGEALQNLARMDELTTNARNAFYKAYKKYHTEELHQETSIEKSDDLDQDQGLSQ